MQLPHFPARGNLSCKVVQQRGLPAILCKQRSTCCCQVNTLVAPCQSTPLELQWQHTPTTLLCINTATDLCGPDSRQNSNDLHSRPYAATAAAALQHPPSCQPQDAT